VDRPAGNRSIAFCNPPSIGLRRSVPRFWHARAPMIRCSVPRWNRFSRRTTSRTASSSGPASAKLWTALYKSAPFFSVLWSSQRKVV
jgi:hypothetical protein